MIENQLGVDVDQIALELTEEMEDMSEATAQSLLSPAAKKERLKLEIAQELTIHFTMFAKGVENLLENLQKLIDEKKEIDQKIYLDITKKLADKKIDEFTNEEITALFIAAADLYNQKEYEKAADAFYVLTIFDPTRSLFWKCLGNAKFHSDHFKDALDAYAMAIKINQQDPECMFYQAQCLVKENRLQEAIDLLDQADEMVTQYPQYEPLKNAVRTLIQELKK